MLQLCGCIAILFASTSLNATAQTAKPVIVSELVKEVVGYQLAYIQHRTAFFQYEVRHTDSKEDITRLLVESVDGSIGRLISRDGRALTADEDKAEQNRLRSITSADMARKHKNELEGEKFAAELVAAMPAAMNYNLTPGQPQLEKVGRPQIVLDYSPNPNFHPASTVQNLLTGLEGRIWVDAGDHHLIRMEIKIIHDLNLAWGLLARVYHGGHVEYDQQNTGNGQYAYTRLAIDVTLRELMFKVVPYRSLILSSHHRSLAPAPSRDEAVRLLLNSPVTTAPHSSK